MKSSNWLEKPCFLVGAERSGTTMLRLMLDGHPELAWWSEFEFSVDHLSSPGVWPDTREFLQTLETDRIFNSYDLVSDETLTYPELINSFIHQKQVRDRKQLVGATIHRNFDRILWMWPDARFIHILRDPRDVAKSCIAMGWAGNTWKGVERWIEAEQLWDHIKEQIDPSRYIEVRYEVLIAEPEKTLTQICEFLGLSYSPEMLSYPERTTYDAPNPRYAYQWKHKMRKQDVQLIEAQVAELLVKRGYELSGYSIPSISSVQAKTLKLQDWWARAQFRMQRLGLPLFVADYLARRIAPYSIQRVLQIRINQLEEAYLK